MSRNHRGLVLALVYLAAVTVVHAVEPWPKATEYVLEGDDKLIELTNGGVHYCVPDDRELQQMGGSGGPIAVIKVCDKSKKVIATLTEQSVGGRILEDYHGLPQFEIWSRAGGGAWCRSLYRYEGKEYTYIRTDEFTDFVGHARDKTVTTTLPGGEGVMYFVETRYPEKDRGSQGR